MSILIVTLSYGNWEEIKRLCYCNCWNKIIFVTTKNIKFNIRNKETYFVIVDKRDFEDMVNYLKEKLNDLIDEFEIGLNIFLGDGKLHMALISSLLSLGISINFVGIKENKIIFF